MQRFGKFRFWRTLLDHGRLSLHAYRRVVMAIAVFVAIANLGFGAELKLLFMGDNGHHRPAARFAELAPALESRGIAVFYTDRMEDLSDNNLANYDGLVLYANIDRIEAEQAQAVLDFVAGGKGFIPLHCATYCWRNNREMVDLMGGQFKRHGGQVFTTEVARANHPIMRGYGSFRSWDETYIHHLHNERNRTVLEYRVEGEQEEGNEREPWTWIRTHGKGRVFYTAWGHDHRTFQQPGFHNLVERGIRWACGDDPSKVPAFVDRDRFSSPQMTTISDDLKDFEYVDVGPKIPNYTPGQRWGVQGKPKTLMQKPLSAQESMKHFVTPVGMQVKLFADETNFQAKPIAMTWDERGRLWICETVDYPNELGGNRDRIRICEDTDGDFVADKFTVFAEGLSIPTAIVIYRGGAVVQNGTETIYLRDTDGDDVSDERTTLLTGWALGDTHGGVSNFRYGLDNWIWAMQGYNNSTPQIDGKPTQTFRMGFWRFKLSQADPPRVTDLEFVRSSDNNTWGLGISEEGLIFGSTANHNPSMFVPIPNRYYESVRGWAPDTLHSIADTFKFKPITENVRQVDQFGGYTAGAGHALYTARAFPQQWWNKTAFVCGPTGHLVGTFVLRRDGANYTSSSPINLLASDDEWTAPIMAEVGPDGAVWIIDWYNYIVQHNPTPQGFETGKGNAYRSDLRDKTHGRIYRVTPSSDTALHPYQSLAAASNAQLVKTLTHPSMRWRLQAQRLLVEREANDVTAQLVALVKDQSVDAIGLNVGAIHGMHVMQGLGLLNAKVAQQAIESALAHPSAGVRRNAVSLLQHVDTGLQILLRNRALFRDDDSQVRLAACLALADSKRESDEAAGVVRELTRQNADPVIIDGLTAAAATHAIPFIRSLGEASEPMADAERQVARRIAEHVARSKPNGAKLEIVLRSITRSNPAIANSLLDGLTEGLPTDFSVEASQRLDDALAAAFEKRGAGAKGKLVRLAARLKSKALDNYVEEIAAEMYAKVQDEKSADAGRLEAARDLLNLRPQDSKPVEAIVALLGPKLSPELATQLLQTIQDSRAAASGEVLASAVPSLTPKLKAAAIATMLSRPDWTRILLRSIEEQKVDLDDLSLDQKQALRAFPDPQIQRQAERVLSMSGGLPDADRDKVLKSLMQITMATGSVDNGREMFKKHCSVCHLHGEMGKQIGPNLTGMSVHPKAELLTHIVDPSRSVEGNFRIYTVITNGGRVLNGMLASETRTSITLIDAKANEISIQREDIDELIASKKSLMPEGFEEQMSVSELTDLLEFLADKGQFVPISLDRYATAISTKGLFSNGDDGPDRLVFEDWSPKQFNGIPFVLTDPVGKTRPNVILLNGPYGPLPPKMPKSVSLRCGTAASAIHLLSGVGGWSFPYDRNETVSVIVRLHYTDGETEDHPLMNGVHFADYIRRSDVPKSEFAFRLRGQQIRYLSVAPKRKEAIETIELVKGPDSTAPIVMAVTVQR